MIGLAGNGEHTHFGIGAIMNDGSFVNLFAPTDMKKRLHECCRLWCYHGLT